MFFLSPSPLFSLLSSLFSLLSSSSSPLASAVTAWQGSAYLVTLLGAWLADAVCGRFLVIIVGSLLYQVGLAGVVAVTATQGNAAALLGTLAICALGTGGIKASVGSFGADQFDLSSPNCDPREARGLARYFNFFYVSFFGFLNFFLPFRVLSLASLSLTLLLHRLQSSHHQFSINLGAFVASTVVVWIQVR